MMPRIIMAPRLISISFSPWSIAARWALEHHGISYRNTDYLPMIGAPWLRLKTRRFSGKVTVPVLLADADVLMESLAIAQYAEQHGSGASLFPTDAEREIETWNGNAQELAAAGRIPVSEAMRDSDGALREALPRSLRKLPGSLALARKATQYILDKYADVTDVDSIDDIQRRLLSTLQDAIDGNDYLVGGQFSYADIVTASCLQAIKPPAREYIRLGPETRACWTQPELAEAFAPVFAWRDRIYERHYTRPGTR